VILLANPYTPPLAANTFLYLVAKPGFAGFATRYRKDVGVGLALTQNAFTKTYGGSRLPD
jgi:hypothetical protein